MNEDRYDGNGMLKVRCKMLGCKADTAQGRTDFCEEHLAVVHRALGSIQGSMVREPKVGDETHNLVREGAVPSPANQYADALPDGTPCTPDEVAGLNILNLGRNDPFRKIAVCHDRLYDGIRNHTSDITQEEADNWFQEAMLKEAPNHQLGYARAWFRIGAVKLVSAFRKVG